MKPAVNNLRTQILLVLVSAYVPNFVSYKFMFNLTELEFVFLFLYLSFVAEITVCVHVSSTTETREWAWE